MTKEEFTDWYLDSRTKEIFRRVERECLDLARLLGRTAGVNQLQDRYTTGVIRGLEKVLELEYEENDAETVSV